MVILGERGLSAVVKYLLDLILICGAILLFTLPITLQWCFSNYFWTVGENYSFLLIFLIITGLFCWVMVYELRKMFILLNKRDPFRRENIKSLKRMSLMSLLISLMYIVNIGLYISFLTIVIAIIFLIAALFSIVLAEVFRQAIEVKEENELTI